MVAAVTVTVAGTRIVGEIVTKEHAAGTARRRADAGRHSQKGGKGGSIVAALIPVITAAITQAVSSGQAPYHQAPSRQPRPDNKRPRNYNRNRGAGRGMQQYYNHQGDYDEPEYPPCPADAPEHDHQYDGNHGQYGDFGASQ